jgi:hypothetical protein
VRNGDFAPNAGEFDNLVSFGTDAAGNLYFVDLDGEIFVLEGVSSGSAAPSAAMRTAHATRTLRRHFCLEEWDGATVLWSRGQMIVGGEGFACVRRFHARLAAQK